MTKPQNESRARALAVFALSVGLAVSASYVLAQVPSRTAPVSQADQRSNAPIAHLRAISAIDINAPSLRDQPNIHGIGAMRGADGHPRLFCIDPSHTDQPARLRFDMQSGADTIRYK